MKRIKRSNIPPLSAKAVRSGMKTFSAAEIWNQKRSLMKTLYSDLHPYCFPSHKTFLHILK